VRKKRVTCISAKNLQYLGLRTLILGYKEIKEKEFSEWYKRYNTAANLLKNREEEVEKLCSEMENDLNLIGATAIEDRLQDGVPQAIQNFRRAGIKVWVITGMETFIR
jgi:phospholipid-translocating ATPase